MLNFDHRKLFKVTVYQAQTGGTRTILLGEKREGIREDFYRLFAARNPCGLINPGMDSDIFSGKKQRYIYLTNF